MSRTGVVTWLRDVVTVKTAIQAAVLLAFVIFPFVSPPFQVHQMTEVIVFAVMVLSVNLLTGFAGPISLGQNFFVAIGAYTGALLINTGMPFAVPIASVAAFLVAAVVGLLVGACALRLTDVYLVLVTVALGVLTPIVIKRFEFTGGSEGLPVHAGQASAPAGLAQDQWMYVVCLGVGAVVFAALAYALRRPWRLRLTAVRDNELAARVIGVNAAKTKIMAFAVSSGMAAVGGVLYAYVVGLVAAEAFTLLFAINLVVGAIVGGSRSLWGAVIGGAFIVFVPAWTSGVNEAMGGVVYGVAVILAVILLPGRLTDIVARLRRSTGGRDRLPLNRTPSQTT
ncbi:branched-chain amino acid ABC transporter permease [Streptosporangium sandarakinum]|uniref:branched-chain amino acid ABC transporter permease n=1 Tax=Streptosporangium sandarakinum TaxID=1260955 RepID=UPI003695E570